MINYTQNELKNTASKIEVGRKMIKNKPLKSGITVTINLNDLKEVLKIRAYSEVISDSIINFLKMMREAKDKIEEKL